MAIPLSSNLDWSLANSLWAASLNPLLANILNSTQLLKNIDLVTGNNTINHKLGREMTGWFLTDVQGIATIYRSQPLNSLTLTLTSSADVTISIGVF